MEGHGTPSPALSTSDGYNPPPQIYVPPPQPQPPVQPGQYQGAQPLGQVAQPVPVYPQAHQVQQQQPPPQQQQQHVVVQQQQPQSVEYQQQQQQQPQPQVIYQPQSQAQPVMLQQQQQSPQQAPVQMQYLGQAQQPQQQPPPASPQQQMHPQQIQMQQQRAPLQHHQYVHQQQHHPQQQQQQPPHVQHVHQQHQPQRIIIQQQRTSMQHQPQPHPGQQQPRHVVIAPPQQGHHAGQHPQQQPSNIVRLPPHGQPHHPGQQQQGPSRFVRMPPQPQQQPHHVHHAAAGHPGPPRPRMQTTLQLVGKDGRIMQRAYLLKQARPGAPVQQQHHVPQQPGQPMRLVLHHQGGSPRPTQHVQQQHHHPQQQQQWAQQQQQQQQQQPQHVQQYQYGHPQQQQQQQQQPQQQPQVVQHVPVSQAQPQQPPQPSADPSGEGTIHYNVEHVFEENGKQVRKMPIKINDETLWVDCVPTSSNGPDEGGIMLDLDDGSISSSKTVPKPIPQQPQQQQQQLHAAQPGQQQSQPQFQQPPAKPKKSGKDFTPEECTAVVNRVIEDCVSPAVLSEELGVSVTVIRDWVKKRGHKLPSKYKVTSSNGAKKNPPPAAAATAGPQNIAGTTNQGAINMPGQPQVRPSAPPPSMEGDIPQMAVQPRFGGPQGQQGGPPRFMGPRGFVPHMGQPPRQVMMQVQQPQPGVRQVIVSQGHQTNVPRMPGFHPQQPGAQPRPIGPNGEINRDVAGTESDASSTSSTPTPGVPPKAAQGPGAAGGDAYKAILKPGKLVVCRNCGCVGADFNCCVRCKKKIGDDFKVIDDGSMKGGNVKTVITGAGESKADLRNIRIAGNKRKKKVSDEPVCLTLSSSDEDDDEEGEGVAEGGETSIGAEGEKEKGEGPCGGPPMEMIPTPVIMDDISKGNFIGLCCRSIRVGSYKSMSKDKAVFTQAGIHMKVPDIIDPKESITLNFTKEEVVKVMAHFGRTMPILFLYLAPAACIRVQKVLRMDKKLGLFLDIGSTDDTQRRVTILPDKITEDAKAILEEIFKSVMEHLDSKTANEILVRSSPMDSSKQSKAIQQLRQQHQSKNSNGKKQVDNALSGTVKYCQFPLTGINSVSVTSDDYFCLEDENFLTDVIIDFYLRYLQFKIMSEVDRDRTHIFTTFFYKRLTTRPPANKNKLHEIEDNNMLSPAEKRYDRVKRWTKKVNVFEKDFLVVPICENSHWFVAVICYPGLIGCRRMEDDSVIDTPESQKSIPKNKKGTKKKDKKVLQIGSTSIIPLRGGPDCTERILLDGDNSDRDEAEASDDDMMDEDEDAPFSTVNRSLTRKSPTPPSNPSSSSDEKKIAGEDKDGVKKVGDTPESSSSKGVEAPAVKKEEEEAMDTTEAPEEELKEGSLKLSEDEMDTSENDTIAKVGLSTEVKTEESGKEEKDDDKEKVLKSENSEATAAGTDSTTTPENKVKVEGDSVGGGAAVKKEDERAEDAKDLGKKEDSETTKDGRNANSKNDSTTAKDGKPKSPKPEREAIKQPCILIFDSLNTGSRARVAATLRDYLQCEYNAKIKDGEKRLFTKDTMKGNCPKVPQQPNFSDCGIFLLQYVESLFKDPICDYTLPITSLRSMFSKDVVKMKRDAIAGIIRNLGAEQNPGKTFNFPNLIFCPTQGSGYTDDEDDSEDSSSGFNRSFSSPATSSSSSMLASGISSKTLLSSTPVKITSLAVTSGGSKSALVCIPIKRPGQQGGPPQMPPVTTTTATVTTTATKLLAANNTKMTPVPNPNSAVAKPNAAAAAITTATCSMMQTPPTGSKGGILITKKDGNFSLKKVNGLPVPKPVVSIPLLPKSVTMAAASGSTLSAAASSATTAAAAAATSSTAKATISVPTSSAGHDSTNGKVAVSEIPAVMSNEQSALTSGAAAANSEATMSSSSSHVTSKDAGSGQVDSGSSTNEQQPLAKKARVDSSSAEADSVVDSTTTENAAPVNNKCEAPSSTSS